MPQKSGTPTRRHFQNCCTVFQSACDDILHRPPWKHVAWWSMMIHLRRSGQLKAAWRTSTREDNKGILAILDGNQSWKRRCSVSGCRQDYKTDQDECVNGIRFEWHSSYIIDFIEIMMVCYFICQFKKPRAAHQIINGWLWCHACSKCNATPLLHMTRYYRPIAHHVCEFEMVSQKGGFGDGQDPYMPTVGIYYIENTYIITSLPGVYWRTIVDYMTALIYGERVWY
jgi:hypothetical protein